jgi:hypothetical protein
MYQPQMTLLKPLLIAALLLCYFNASALEFLPGAGAGLEYTNNARFTADNQVDDLIAVGYVGFKLEEAEGPVRADITTSLNHTRYTKDTFDDRRYFNLGATADWEMIKNRFNWLLRDYYGQRLINTSIPNTPDNTQDSNVFTFGANIVLPISARQSFTLLPIYRNFYYEFQGNNNQTYSLDANWNYLLTELTNVGITGNARKLDYDDPVILDVTFTSVYFMVASQLARSNFTTNLGVTGVERDNGQSTAEFAGNLNWEFDLTGISSLRFFVATGLTDANLSALNAIEDPGTGDPDDIQITTDVVRNQVLSLGYTREDGTLKSNLTGRLQELNYSESPNDRRIRSLDALLAYPVSTLLTSSLYARYKHTEYIDIARRDNDYIVGGNLRYRLSSKLNSMLDLRYRSRISTLDPQNFDAWSAYVTLAYGFGKSRRPTGAGGF